MDMVIDVKETAKISIFITWDYLTLTQALQWPDPCKYDEYMITLVKKYGVPGG